jgi:putative transposase
MEDISTVLAGLKGYIGRGSYQRLVEVVLAVLGMSGRITMLGITRWTSGGCGYRSVERLFEGGINWNWARWWLLRRWGICGEAEHLLVGDVSVISKSGRKTYGLGWFYSGLAGARIKRVASLVFGVVSPQKRQCYPLQSVQLVPAAAAVPAPDRPKRKPGRPKGGKSKDKTKIEWTPSLTCFARCWQRAQGWLKIRYVVLDGQYGNNTTLQIVRHVSQQTWHLISKLGRDAELYLWYAGDPPKRGRRLKGERLDYDHLPADKQVATTLEGTLRTSIYHAKVYYLPFPQPLNVVIIVKEEIEHHRRSHLILFSSDLDLPYAKLIDYYSLRFQLEFVFRDAKQHFGWEDWMNVAPPRVATALQFPLFMVLLSRYLFAQWHPSHPHASILDLKAFFRARRYALELLTHFPESPDSFSLHTLTRRLATLGMIHPPPAA